MPAPPGWLLRGQARFTSRDTVDVDGRRLRCSRIVIATGATPVVPPIDGLADAPFLTTESVFDLTDPPQSLAIIGGVAVGCGLAQAFARLGVQVSIVEAKVAAATEFRGSFHVGDRAGNFVLTRLDDGARVELADLWRSQPLVMEFGSGT